MNILHPANHTLGRWLIKDFDETRNKSVRIRYGVVAGWLSIFATTSLFIVKLILGLMDGSEERIIVLADIDAAVDFPETEFNSLASDLESLVKQAIPNVAYSSFYVTPKFSY